LLTGEQALVDEVRNTLAEVHTVLVVSKVHVDTPIVVGQVELKFEVAVFSYWRRDIDTGILEQEWDRCGRQGRVCQVDAGGHLLQTILFLDCISYLETLRVHSWARRIPTFRRSGNGVDGRQAE
jgi:hypothetical protein